MLLAARSVKHCVAYGLRRNCKAIFQTCTVIGRQSKKYLQNCSGAFRAECLRLSQSCSALQRSLLLLASACFLPSCPCSHSWPATQSLSGSFLLFFLFVVCSVFFGLSSCFVGVFCCCACCQPTEVKDCRVVFFPRVWPMSHCGSVLT